MGIFIDFFKGFGMGCPKRKDKPTEQEKIDNVYVGECPITLNPVKMQNVMILPSGQFCERDQMSQWIRTCEECGTLIKDPTTNLDIKHGFVAKNAFVKQEKTLTISQEKSEKIWTKLNDRKVLDKRGILNSINAAVHDALRSEDTRVQKHVIGILKKVQNEKEEEGMCWHRGPIRCIAQKVTEEKALLAQVKLLEQSEEKVLLAQVELLEQSVELLEQSLGRKNRMMYGLLFMLCASLSYNFWGGNRGSNEFKSIIPEVNVDRESQCPGDPAAQSRLEAMSREVSGVPQGDGEAANRVDVTGLYNQAYMYRSGIGVEKSHEEAVKLYRKAADNEHVESMNELAYMYHHGMGVEQNDKEAFKWYRQAAKKRNAMAQNNLGSMYLLGIGVEQNDKEAFKWYRKAVKNGEVNSMNELAYMYGEGKGVEQSDKQAFEWFQKAAKKGNALAQYNLGYMHEHGIGVEQSYKEAFKWYRKAAEQGHASAQYNLARMYMGRGGRNPNYNQAFKWCLKAADQGHAMAQNDLATMYERGNGVAKDDNQAVEWYRKAANQGNARAKKNLERFL